MQPFYALEVTVLLEVHLWLQSTNAWHPFAAPECASVEAGTQRCLCASSFSGQLSCRLPYIHLRVLNI